MNRIRFSMVGFVVLGLVLAGCCGTGKGYVMNQWSQTMHEEGIVPIFPPREDVQVGDVFAYSYDPEGPQAEAEMEQGNRTIGMSPRLTNIVPLEKVVAEYKARPYWPSSPAELVDILNDAQKKLYPIAAATNGIFVVDPTPGRLRLVAFPDFSVTEFSQGNLAAMVPIESFTVAIGAAYSHYHSVSVKIPSAESYGISLTNLSLVGPGGMFQSTQPVDSPPPPDPTKKAADGGAVKPIAGPPIRSLLGLQLLDTYRLAARLSASKTGDVWLRIVTEVYYARAMDISIQYKSSTGATVGGKPTAASATTSTPPSPEIIDPSLSFVEQAKKVNEFLAQSRSQSVPGGFVQFVSATDTAVGVRRVWDRPIAIGIRGITVRLDRDGNVLGRGYSTGITPSVSVESTK